VNYGRDLGFEVGFAYGLGKPIIALVEGEDYEKDRMIAGSLTAIATSVKELIAKVKACTERKLGPGAVTSPF
jgi:nucleoside 2-deoxyribosyltransferase